jgi:hypothetical protein
MDWVSKLFDIGNAEAGSYLGSESFREQAIQHLLRQKLKRGKLKRWWIRQ